MKDQKSISDILKNAKQNLKEVSKDSVKYKKNDSGVLDYDVSNLTVQQRIEIVKFLNKNPKSKESKELINSKLNSGLNEFINPTPQPKTKSKIKSKK